jgi:hypothetical protein
MKIFSLKIFCFLLILIAIPFFSIQAQVTSANNTNLSIAISPENPTPGSQVTVTLQSYSLDLDRAQITWSVNGAEKQTDIGLKSYYLQAGTAGTPVTVSAKIEVKETLLNKEITFTPAGIDILFEAVSYVPPFYKGKAMNTNQGTIVVVAFPEVFDQNGNKFPTNDLVYNWKKDDIVLQDVSGLGKNYFTYSGTVPIRDSKIEVTASSIDRSMTANSSITITTGSPKIVFYENNPIYGIMTNKAIKNTVQMLSDEFSVIAMPYFFSAGYDVSPNLDYEWTFNGQAVENQDPKNSFTVRQEAKGSGSAGIGLKVSNNSRIFQFTNNNFVINFQKQ